MISGNAPWSSLNDLWNKADGFNRFSLPKYGLSLTVVVENKTTPQRKCHSTSGKRIFHSRAPLLFYHLWIFSFSIQNCSFYSLYLENGPSLTTFCPLIGRGVRADENGTLGSGISDMRSHTGFPIDPGIEYKRIKEKVAFHLLTRK